MTGAVPPEGDDRLPYRVWVFRTDPADPHWECVASASDLDGAVDIGQGWADGGAAVRIDRTIWRRP